MRRIVQVALELPLRRLFDYLPPEGERIGEDDVGYRVRVPFGKKTKVGVIVGLAEESGFPDEKLRSLDAVLRDLPALPPEWFRLCAFCADYYHAPLGEVMLSTLPAAFRRARSVKARQDRKPASPLAASPLPPTLTAAQNRAVSQIIGDASSGYRAWLLYGVTGSGKTEVYLRLIGHALSKKRQALLLTPEINLTPQLENHIRARFPGETLVCLHSDLTEAARARNWSAAFHGKARIVLGTRLAVFAPMPDLGLVIVDEEHDASFKQQDGIRYSARDLAVTRARDRAIPIVLGSATPSLESWANATDQRAKKRYSLLELKERAVENASLPTIRRIDTRKEKLKDGLSDVLLKALADRFDKKEQSLIFLNRRGYAPVLACAYCGWVSRCERCSANLVVHLLDHALRCHHCGGERSIPRACPACGNPDIQAFGRGTQRIEAQLGECFPDAKIVRIDRDSAKSRKQWEALLEQIHGGEADILVGTQMLAKGHDFPRLTLVGVLGADAALFSSDWRAPERLFAQLTQVSGRAGRAGLAGEVLIQTQFPDHPLFEAISRQDYPAYARTLLDERRQIGFPPFAFQAVLRAEAPQMAESIAFLSAARAGAETLLRNAFDDILLYDPVPMRLARLQNLERAQLLVESPNRRNLQCFLREWRRIAETIKARSNLRWHLEVDPLEF